MGTSRAAVLALDIGTSSARAGLYDLDARPLTGRAAHTSYSPGLTVGGGAEFDARWLLDQVIRVVDDVMSQSPDEVAVVAASTFWHSLLGLGEDGQPLTPLYLWLDARSRSEAASLRQHLDERAIHARTGCVLHWSYWPAKLRWLRRADADVFHGVARWVSFGEFLLEQLTGAWRISVSMASATGLLDQHTCDWDAELLDACGVRREQLGRSAPLRDGVRLRSEFAQRWPGLSGAACLPAVGDGACSSIGAGCATPAHFALMIGTSGAERVVFRPADGFGIPWGVWCYRVDEQRAVMGGAFNDGGSLFDWLHGAIRLPDLQMAERAVAELEPDAHGLTVLPFWGGERSTGWADDARGAIVGLRLHTRPVEVLRASMEAIALRFAEVDRRLLKAIPSRGEVVGTGGALLHSPAWLQIIADVLGRPVLASSELEASSRGAALLGLEATGLLRQPIESLRPDVERRFEPIAAHTERYRVAVERQRRLYDALIAHD